MGGDSLWFHLPQSPGSGFCLATDAHWQPSQWRPSSCGRLCGSEHRPKKLLGQWPRLTLSLIYREIVEGLNYSLNNGAEGYTVISVETIRQKSVEMDQGVYPTENVQ